jgi:hypothetical protein
VHLWWGRAGRGSSRRPGRVEVLLGPSSLMARSSQGGGGVGTRLPGLAGARGRHALAISRRGQGPRGRGRPARRPRSG